MITKTVKDHLIKQSATCGELREILFGSDYPHLNIAIAQDIKPTKAHFHKNFDEIYFVLDGKLSLKFFYPETSKTSSQVLESSELCVITKGVHHVVVEASAGSRLCVITVPRFDPRDEHLSDRL